MYLSYSYIYTPLPNTIQVINKMDRLILELKLPPADAYYKLLHTIEEVNKIITLHTTSNTTSNTPSNKMFNTPLLSPSKGNVCFASGQHGWSFTLESYSQLYLNKHTTGTSEFGGLNPSDLAKRMWGDWYHDTEKSVFTKVKPRGVSSSQRTFVTYILEPLYKIYSQVISESPEELSLVLKRLNIHLKHKEIHMDSKPLLRLILSKYFGYPRGFVHMIITHIQSPYENNKNKALSYYTGYQTSSIAYDMYNCVSNHTNNITTHTTPHTTTTTNNTNTNNTNSSNNSVLMINAVKMYSSSDGSKFYTFGRIFSGSVTVGQTVQVLG